METTPPIEDVLQDFDERRRWPKDVAELVASCRPSDETLLELMRCDSERHQSLALHAIALLVEDERPTTLPGESVAKEVLRLLDTEGFKPKRRFTRKLETWANGGLRRLYEKAEPPLNATRS